MVLRGLLTFSILMCVQVAVNADTDPSDASALNMLFQSMNNPAELAGWSASGNDPCGQSWKGVTCSGSRVTQIKLPGLGVAGSLGYQLTSLTSLTELDVSNNNLGGTIPYNLPPHLQRLNLGNNNFSGGIPYSISQMPTLTYLNIGHNQLNELLEDMFGQLSSLATMDISHNSIPGPLPQSLSNLSNINSLYLQNNQFTGTIDVLANLTTLQNLNVANNHFTGGIPEALQNINIQRDGNSWNTGPAPPSPPGSPHYTRTHSASKSRSDESAERRRKSGLSGGGIAGIVISIILVVVGAITAFLLIKQRSREPQQGDVEKVDDSKNVKRFITIPSNEIQTAEKTIQTFSSIKTIDPAANISLKPPPLGPQKSFDREKEVSVLSNSVVKSKSRVIPPNVKSYSIADLQIATCSFSYENLLGEGSLGSVYRAEFENENVLAVKKVNSSAVSNCCEDFTEIVANISRLHHPNITELVGYCSEHGQHLLVYEFHKNGSLHEFMHLPDEQQNKPLSWQSRVKIALGSARALEYLHETCSPPVVHRNFKSENILLDGELSPHVSDSGLAIFLPDVDQRIDHNCCAPEVADIGEYTMKSDVYGFGVVMLELLTGRKPFDSSRPRSKQSLVRWATPQLHDIDALTNMVDPLLEGLYPVKSLSRFADVIALCLQPEPEFRPPMSEVVQALVQLAQRANLSRRTTF